MNLEKSGQNFSVTGIGLMTAIGTSIDELYQAIKSPTNLAKGADYSMKGISVANHLSDKRMMKAVSHRDSVGLAAIEVLKKEMRYTSTEVDPYRRGMFVGACPSTVDDNENYLEAVQRSSAESHGGGEALFGKFCMDARPTTLLLGLPNNVLCYGSILLEAKGPNDNYTSGEISALVGMHVALRNLRRGRIKLAICGGYSSQTNPYSLEVVRGRGDLASAYDEESLGSELNLAHGTIPADAAAFVAIESDLAEVRKDLECALLLGTALASNSSGPTELGNKETDAKIILDMVARCLRDANVSAEELDFIFVSGCGISRIDCSEMDAVEKLKEQAGKSIPILSVAPLTKNLFEASGIVEIGIAARISADGVIPPAICLRNGEEMAQGKSRRHFVIVRSSSFGEFAAACLSVTGGSK
jgi:3-oxoacyl-[acyl-carrier-protein] synthase II